MTHVRCVMHSGRPVFSGLLACAALLALGACAEKPTPVASSPAGAASGSPVCRVPDSELGHRVDTLQIGMNAADVNAVLKDPGVETSIPAYVYRDPAGGDFWVSYVDLDANAPSAANASGEGLRVVAYYPPGSHDGCYVLPVERRGKRLTSSVAAPD